MAQWTKLLLYNQEDTYLYPSNPEIWGRSIFSSLCYSKLRKQRQKISGASCFIKLIGHIGKLSVCLRDPVSPCKVEENSRFLSWPWVSTDRCTLMHASFFILICALTRQWTCVNPHTSHTCAHLKEDTGRMRVRKKRRKVCERLIDVCKD